MAQLDPAAITSDPHVVRRSLAVLAGKLKVHAAMEDEALYPSLLSHADPNVQRVARDFRAQFGGVYEIFLAYVARWTPEAIAANAAEFVKETRGAMTALGERIVHENDELYAMVDAAG